MEEDFGRFYDSHADMLAAWFAPQVHDPDDVGDLVGETFAAALLNRHRANEPASEWLLGLAGRELAAYRRRGDAERRIRRRLGIGGGVLRAELVAAAEREGARRAPRRSLPPARVVLGAAAGLLLVAILVLALAGGPSDEPQPARRAAAPSPTQGDRQLLGGTLEPGVRYRATALLPPLSFVVDDAGWVQVETGDTTSLLLERGVQGEPGSERPPLQGLSFARMTEVFDPALRGLTGSLVPAPVDLRAWLSEHPDLRVGPAEPVTIAGVPGEVFTVEVRFRRPVHGDPRCRRTFMRSCTAIAPGASFVDGTRLRMHVLRTEPDPLLVTTIAAPGGDLGDLERAAAPVLDSLRIGVE